MAAIGLRSNLLRRGLAGLRRRQVTAIRFGVAGAGCGRGGALDAALPPHAASFHRHDDRIRRQRLTLFDGGGCKATGAIIHQAVNGATVGPLLIARYQYINAGITKSCQLTVRVDKVSGNPTQCVLNSLSFSFIRTDGTGTSPRCGNPTVAAENYSNCTFVINATMQN